jgi:hypothetical protein
MCALRLRNSFSYFTFLLDCLLALSLSSLAAFARTTTRLAASGGKEDGPSSAQSKPGSGPQFAERGVSVDQDGKSNVWAIEPKVEVETKSSEEKGQTALFAGGGLAAVAASAAVILSNLPDPNQF